MSTDSVYQLLLMRLVVYQLCKLVFWTYYS